MAEYSRLASGQVVSTGDQTLVVLPFIPNYIEISNRTRAVAGAGVTRAWWMTDMGQGSAFLDTFGTGEQFIAPVGGTSSGALVSGTGFTTIQAGLSLQYGPVYNAAVGTFSISKASPALVTTSVAHNLVTGNWVIFSNLAQTSTTGMQQIAGIPFMVTVTGATTFTIPWNTNQSNYTAFDSATSTGGVGSWKKILYPVLYAPGVSYISAITLGATTTVVTTAPHNFVVGQEVAFRIPAVPGVSPAAWGTVELNSLPNVLIPGSPIYGYVVSVTNSTTVVVNINSTTYTAFNSNVPFISYPGLKFPQIVAVGDVNTGGWPISAGSDLYPSPQVFNGFTASTTVGARTINGPAIMGAYINATFMGFVIGDSVAGTAADVIYWRAYMHDINYP